MIAASGSSGDAGLPAEVLVERLSGIHVDVEYAYRPDSDNKRAAIMGISQSGETSDTLAALRKANLGIRTVAITNESLSSMARAASVSFPTVAGTKLAVPATKSFRSVR